MPTITQHDLIERIVTAARNRKPHLRIVARRCWINPETGATVSALAMDRARDGWERRLYWCFEMPDGTTCGKQFPTEADARADYQQRLDAADAEFRAALAIMSAADLAKQAECWLK